MASYDVEALRMRRFAASHQGIEKIALQWESHRAKRFEKDNLALYDGVIAVSELDKTIFTDEYGIASERVLVADNGIDPDYFSFQKRKTQEKPEIVFVGSFTYLSNRQAAWRLLKKIMPLVWRKTPNARVWIVGQKPDSELLAQSDGEKGHGDRQCGGCAPVSGACCQSGVSHWYPVPAPSTKCWKRFVPVCRWFARRLPLKAWNFVRESTCLLEESDEQLADAVNKLIKNPGRVADLAKNGHDWVVQRYSWDKVLGRLEDWLRLLAEMPKRTVESGRWI